MTNSRTPLIRRKPVAALTPEEVEQLWTCYSRYAHTTREIFVEGLQSARDVYMFFDRDIESLVGFYALRALKVTSEGRAFAILYVNYADIDPHSRGHNLLQRVVLPELLKLKLSNPLSAVYLMYTASTYTSYLLLTRNAAEYWPSPHLPTPDAIRHLMDCVMTTLEKDGWNMATGLIHRDGTVRYRVGVVGNDAQLLRVPAIRYYAELNPRQHNGDTLVCACPLTLRNFVCTAWRMLRRVLRQRRAAQVGGEDAANHG